MQHKTTSSAMLGMNIGKEYIHCVLFHEERVRSMIICNSADGFADLLSWLQAHMVRRVHAFCDSLAKRWQSIADFMRFVGHEVTVLDEHQMIMIADALTRQDTRKLALVA